MGKKVVPKFVGRKKSQEEMVGFGIIIGIVAIILVVFLWFFLSNSKGKSIESYEVNSFIQSALQVTSECEGPRGYFDVGDLIYECYNFKECKNKENSCEMLNWTIEEMVESGFKIGEDAPINGYKWTIMVEDEVLVDLEKGNLTGNSRGGFSRMGNRIEVFLDVYTKP